MEYRKLGKWGAKVSSLSLGTYLTVGFTSDAETSKALVKTALDAGINYFDTADAYNKGEAETALGKLVAGAKRSDLFILTKVWAPMSGDPNDRGLSAKHIKESCDKSLRRLGMEYVDCYMCHRPDPETPLEETMMALDQIVRSGKALYAGISNYNQALTEQAAAILNDLGTPLLINQRRYSLFDRAIERDNLKGWAAANGVGIIALLNGIELGIDNLPMLAGQGVGG